MLKTLSLTFFRNFENRVFEFQGGLNIIIGKNGSGKTNLLESIAYLSFPRSFRGVLDSDLVMWGEDFFRIEGLYQDDVEHMIKCFYSSHNRVKKIHVNEKKVDRLSKLFFLFPTLVSTDRDQDIVDGPPEKRRSLFDKLISLVDMHYYRTLIDYRKAIENKNVLLKEKRLEEVKYWNREIEKLSTYIITKRTEFLREITVTFDLKSGVLLNGKKADIRYFKKIDMEEGILDSKLEEELEFGFSIYGPHRDRFEFYIEGRPAKAAASEAEKRMMLLSLYFAFMERFEKDKDKKPVLILDEPLSILDDERIEALLGQLESQVFITTPRWGLQYEANLIEL